VGVWWVGCSRQPGAGQAQVETCEDGNRAHGVVELSALRMRTAQGVCISIFYMYTYNHVLHIHPKTVRGKGPMAMCRKCPRAFPFLGRDWVKPTKGGRTQPA
jgi:hypothetical protein